MVRLSLPLSWLVLLCACEPKGGPSPDVATTPTGSAGRAHVGAPTAAAETARAPSSACRQSDECRIRGACSPHGDGCIAASDADCGRSTWCAAMGACRLERDRCVVARAEDCRSSAWCRELGTCGIDLERKRCAATSDADCSASKQCAREGDCFANLKVEGRPYDPDNWGTCMALDSADCQASEACSKERRCSASQFACRVHAAATPPAGEDRCGCAPDQVNCLMRCAQQREPEDAPGCGCDRQDLMCNMACAAK